jgi:LysR family glycine cleavage system transcriptional activator
MVGGWPVQGMGARSMERPYRRQLPPLNALRAFEAVARYLSFVKAADHLLVTQSAVSRQVKNLEDILGVALLKRKGAVELTEDGKNLLPVLTDSFDRMAEVITGFRQARTRPPLVLSMPPTFAYRMLLPWLPRFQRQHPDLEIRLETPSSNADFDGTSVDLAIHFGEVNADDMIVDLLMQEELTPVCSPALAAGVADLSSLLETGPLLHIRQPGNMYLCWSLFARQSGLEDIDIRRGLVLETADQAVQLAMNDGGIAVVDIRLCAEELASGKLVVPFDRTIVSGSNYFLVSRTEEIDIPRIVAFRSWVLDQFAAAEHDPLGRC